MKRPSPLQARFGRRLRILRNRLGLSQENFALAILMDRSYYTGVENGRHNISLANIAKVAQGHGLSLEELFRDL